MDYKRRKARMRGRASFVRAKQRVQESAWKECTETLYDKDGDGEPTGAWALACAVYAVQRAAPHVVGNIVWDHDPDITRALLHDHPVLKTVCKSATQLVVLSWISANRHSHVRGIGARLLCSTLQALRKHGIRALFLVAVTSLTRLPRLRAYYEQFGFRPITTNPGERNMYARLTTTIRACSQLDAIPISDRS